MAHAPRPVSRPISGDVIRNYASADRSRGGDYFLTFMARWPQLSDLAAASPDDVMKLWAGLGYYSRARNLHKAAQAIMSDYHGQFPDTEKVLIKLPGIGSYTAAAIAAIAFGRHAVVIDANIERIIARFAAISAPLPAAKPAIRAALEKLTPANRSGDFAQALMDIGNRICTPPRKKAGQLSQPQCLICPLASGCQGGMLIHLLGQKTSQA